MTEKVRNLLANGKKVSLLPFIPPADLFGLHRALCEATQAVGNEMERRQRGVWEGQSLNGDHLWSRNDLDASGLLISSVAEAVGREGVQVDMSFEGEKILLVSPRRTNGRGLRLVYDPIDGSKAFDNWKVGGDCPLPRPSSAVSLAAVCPVSGETVASAVYCFDLGEVFSSVFLGRTADARPKYSAFRERTLLEPLPQNGNGVPAIEAKRRVLCGDYNSKALLEIARLELALMERGLKVAYGGLTGSSATDIINVIRGSYCVCLDVRALCAAGGSVPYWYDVAGALPIAMGRGLDVVVTDSQGVPLEGGHHDIYTPVAFVVARADIAQLVLEAIRSTVCADFLSQAAVAATAA